MNENPAKLVLQNFITNNFNDAMALIGDWGIGKTELWKRTYEENKKNSPFDKYVYISLFGLNDIQSIRSSIFMQTVVNRVDAKTKPTYQKMWDRIKDKLSQNQNVSGIRDLMGEIPYIKSISFGIDLIAINGVYETLICIDDFERMSDQIKVEDLLGLISQLKIERKCKVILIFNKSKLNKNLEVVYQNFKEKVIDAEIVLSPSREDIEDIAFDKTFFYRSRLIYATDRLNITNIRILKRIERLALEVADLFDGLHQSTKNQVIDLIVLFTWLHLGPSENHIEKSFLKKWGSEKWSVRKHFSKEKIPEKEIEWANLLEAYGFKIFDDFSAVIEAFVDNGYLNKDKFLFVAKEHSSKAEISCREDYFDTGWNLFHGSLEDNEKQVIEMWVKGVEVDSSRISPGNFNSTIVCMRELGYQSVASRLIDVYINSNGHRPGIFNIKSSLLGNYQLDKEVEEKFENAYSKSKESITFEAAVESLKKDKILTDDVLSAFSKASKNEIRSFIIELRGEQLWDTIRDFLAVGHSDDPIRKLVSKNFVYVLDSFMKESTLNQIRLRRYGSKFVSEDDEFN